VQPSNVLPLLCPPFFFNHLRIALVLPHTLNLFLFNQLRIAQFASPLF
jgi:hypothetical protein